MNAIALKKGALCFAFFLAIRMTQASDTSTVIPWSQAAAKAGADDKGDGLAVTSTGSGARLRCLFQRLDGEASTEGLWLTSTVTNTTDDRFRVTAVEVGRRAAKAISGVPLAGTGEVSMDGQTVRFRRPDLREEYSVSMDGVRQDFIVEQSPPRPPGGKLVVKLAVTGARVEPAADGVRLLLAHSGRKIAYSRLRVTDASGKPLRARMELCSEEDEWTSFLAPEEEDVMLAVLVDDEDAVYPVRIDPTFSDANWVSLGGIPGANSDVYAAVTDGSGNLYLGGDFTQIGNTQANYVAEWNGKSWSALGSGMDADVLALAVSNGVLYAGGLFTSAGGSAANLIAQWNGSNWSALASGMTGLGVDALAISGTTLYAGGAFATAGGATASNIAQWNGTSWSALGPGTGDPVYALAVSGSTLYAAGLFTNVGSTQANFIAQWNGTSWSALDSGLDMPVLALAVSGSTLYAGGYLFDEGDQPAFGVAQWNGTNWSGSKGYYSTVIGVVNALAVSGGTLYVGGSFESVGNGSPLSEANNIAQWNGTNWSVLGSGMNSDVYALAVSGSTLYAGGDFSTAGGNAANYAAQWNGSNWLALGSGMGQPVAALAVSGGTLYAGGSFTTAGGDTDANYIAQWNGSGWSSLGPGLNSNVYALAWSDGTLYVGGDFTTAGGNAAKCVAQWNGSNWSALGSGVSGASGTGIDGYGPYVSALAVFGATLYVGGDFTTAGGNAANCIAQWNGTNWSALGPGVAGLASNGYGPDISALAVLNGTLYAAGDFTTAGGSPANGIAQWNENTWSALGPGVSGLGSDGYGPYVSVLAVSGGALYVGGDFTKAGSNTVHGIAQWNAESWLPLGSGVNGYVDALAVSGGMLYAGGDFTSASGSAANGIAQWNGNNWSALGSGISGIGDGYGPYVSVLAVSGGVLYAGGDFTTAGTNVSGYVAEAILPPISLAIITANAAFGFTNGVFGFDISGPAGSNVVIEASTDLQNWVPLQTNLLDSGPLYFSDARAPAGSQRFYRAVLP